LLSLCSFLLSSCSADFFAQAEPVISFSAMSLCYKSLTLL
jgi:hypothetical protein